MPVTGFGSQHLTAVLRQIEVRKTKDQERNASSWLDEIQKLQPTEQNLAPQFPTTKIKIHPWLWCASNKRAEQGLFRVHTLIEHFRAGRSWISIEELNKQLVETAVFKKDTLIRYIKRGNRGRWSYVPKQNRIYAFSLARVAANMGLTKEAIGRASIIETDAAYEGLETFNRAAYASWLASVNKKNPKPISRATQSKLTGLSERTLRKYTEKNAMNCK